MLKGAGFKITLVVILFFLLSPLDIVYSEENSGLLFPDSKNFESFLPISLHLGQSWVDNNGHSYVGHLGEDFVGDVGTPIFSIADGVVEKFIDWPTCPRSKNHGWGPVLLVKYIVDEPLKFISHGSILTTGTTENPKEIFVQYSHIENITLNAGDKVGKGQRLGTIAKVCPYIPHMHFEIKDSVAFNTDIALNTGPGTGYSGTNNYAPNRYMPSKFIELNRNLVLGEEKTKFVEIRNPEPDQKSISTSLFSRISTFTKQQKDNFFAYTYSVFNKNNPAIASNPTNNEVSTTNNENNVAIEQSDNVENKIYNTSIYTPQKISVSPSEVVPLVLKAKNTGNASWQKNSISANVVGGPAPNALYYTPTWLTQLRPARLDQSVVTPGQDGTFSFSINTPDIPGTYLFRLQIVRQSGGSFLQVGRDFFVVEIEVKKNSVPIAKNISTEIPNIPPIIIEDTTIFENVLDEVRGLVKKVPLPTWIYGGGGGSSNEETVETTEVTEETTGRDEEEEVVETESQIEIPEISVASPTSSFSTTTASSTTIFGTYNTSTENIFVNGTSTTNLVMQNLVWEYFTFLNTATNTFSFVGWNAGNTTSTDTVTIDIFREEEIVEEIVLSAPVILSPTTLATYTTSSTTLTLSGTKDSLATDVVITFDNVSSTVDSVTTATWEHNLSLTEGENIIVLYAVDESGNVSATSSINISYEQDVTETEPELVLISEIGWMGTLASPNDEWIELYNPTYSNISLEGWTIVWGDQNTTTFEHATNLSAISIAAGEYVLLERTDQTTVSDVTGHIYTGAMNNEGEYLRLLNPDGVIVDEVNAEPGWFAGDNSTKESMTRIDPRFSGSEATNWCSYSSCRESLKLFSPEDTKHDADGNEILGTPGVLYREPDSEL